MHSDLRRTGHFACSDDLLNQLHRNVGLGPARQLPRRAHRLPAARRAARLDRRHRRVRADRGVPLRRRRLPPRLAGRPRARAGAPRTGWCRSSSRTSLKYEEHPTEFPPPETAAIWSDAAVWVPWALWQAYGDRRVLERPVRLDGRPRDAGSSRCSRRRGCGTPASSSATGSTRTPRPTSRSRPRPTAAWWPPPALYRTARIVAEAAALLGREDDAAEFACAGRTAALGLQRALRAGRRHHHAATPRRSTPWPSRSACSTRRTAHRAGDRLAELVAANGYHIATGFAGTPFVTDALTRHGAPRRRVPAAAASAAARPGSTRSPWAPRRSGSAGTRCCPTAPSTPAR